jgi:quercetin dioxygenase-like cupin family protein
MITRRDFLVAAVAVLATVGAIAFAQTSPKPIMRSRVFNWDNLKVESTKVGERRSVFDAPTATLRQFESHITTLNPGESPHPPHKHPDEEMMVIKEGTVEAVLNGQTNRVEAGGIIFCGSNEMHGLRNIGTNRATYFVFKWVPNDLKMNQELPVK